MISEADVRAAYRLLLDREPESDVGVADIVRQTRSLAELRERILNCSEFLSKSGNPTSTVRLGNHFVPENWPVKGEGSRSFLKKLRDGFFSEYMSGDLILDIGFRGEWPDAVPILPHAIGIDLDFPGYDGKTLPVADESVDTVYSSHMLEHVDNPHIVIGDWYRAIKCGGYIVCVVPHQHLYEKRLTLPSKWNYDHKRFYTPSLLLYEFETALEPNAYRVRLLRDNDSGYTYDVGPERHAGGAYEIELVIEKREKPQWDLE